MSLAAALPSTFIQTTSLQQVHSLMNEAERDIRRCLRQVGQRPVAESDQACKEIGKRIAGIEADLKALTCDEDTLESFHDLTSDLRCLSTRISIAKRKVQDPDTAVAEKWKGLKDKLEVSARRSCIQQLIELRKAQKTSKEFDPVKFLQDINIVKYTSIENPDVKKDGAPGSMGVFVTSNEMNQKKVRDLLKTCEKIPGGGHFGISGLYNWDLIAHMQSGFAVLVDFNPNMSAFHRNMLQFLIQAKDPKEFVQLALKQIEREMENDPEYFSLNTLYPSHPYYLSLSEIDKIAYELHRMSVREDGALSKKNFPLLQKLAREGKIIPLHLDFCDTDAIQTIANAVHKQGHVFSSLYVSNAYDYLEDQIPLRTAFKQNVRALIQDKTCIVDSIYKPSGMFLTCIPAYLHYGKDPETGNPYDPDVLRGLQDLIQFDQGTYYQKPLPLDAFGESTDD